MYARIYVICLFFVCLIINPVYAGIVDKRQVTGKAMPPPIIGDINNDGEVTLVDAILCLKICADADTSGQTINFDARLPGSIHIGLTEALYALMKVAWSG